MLPDRILHAQYGLRSAAPPWWTPWLFALGTLAIGLLAAQIGLSLPHAASAWRYPKFWPPAWIFWAVWVVIYPCWGLAANLVWRQRHTADVRGAFAFFGATLVSNLFFMPVAGLSGDNPGVMALGDLNGILVACVMAWLFTRYDRGTIWFLAPLLVWMPITFLLKLWYWLVNLPAS